jgi:hypothetical protein
MNPLYQDFIDELVETSRKSFCHNVSRAGAVRGNCVSWSKKLSEKFPELKVVVGFCNGQEHAWCETSENEIIDATWEQFGIIRQYEEYDENNQEHAVKIGRCMNCGEEIFGKMTDDHKDFCDDRCAKDYFDYYGQY